MFEGPGNNVRPDEELGVPVGAEACRWEDAVFVYDAQGAEAHVFGGVVGGEAEGVEGVEPVHVGVAAGVPGAFCDLH